MTKQQNILTTQKQNYPELAKYEILRTIKKYLKNTPEQHNNITIIKNPQNKKNKIMNALNKLALTKNAYQILETQKNYKTLLKKIQTTKYPEISKPKKTYKITIINTQKKQETKNIDEIVTNLKQNNKLGKVNLKNPDTEITIIKEAKNNHLCIKIWENKEKYQERKNDKRPAPHPTSMNPELARALINISEAKNNMLDPFCGSGGILIEAGKILKNIKGGDIDSEMILKAKINLEHYGIQKYELKTQKATEWKEKTESIITDIPYGKSSKLKQKIQELVSDFLKNAKTTTKDIILVHPENKKITKTIQKSKWRPQKIIKIKIHKTLTRQITHLKL
ncbi:methyltransferase domain-containing protein [Candidatus Woesearchaeota archaeon]|nr:methyltransferase domain-containing protein [Candidatus Woesearchaeota archaeon]